MNYKILDINKPTVNGRFYPKDVVDKALNEPIIQEMLKTGGVPVFKLNSADVFEATSIDAFDMNKVVGFVKKFDLSDTALYADIEFINNYSPEQVFALGTGDVSYVNGLNFVDTYNLTVLYIKEK